MSKRISSIEATFLHGHFSLSHKFSDGVNIIFGNNGGGKTTLLNILSNALNGQFNQFGLLDFSNIQIEFDDNKILTISKFSAQEHDSDDTIVVKLDDNLIFSTSTSQAVSDFDILKKKDLEINKYELPAIIYFPAYRVLYDYLNLSSEKNYQILSPFSPLIQFPSLKEIENKLREEATLSEISSETKLFIESVNKFYENKKIVVNLNSNLPPFEIIYDDKKTSRQLSSFSSGERQITTILFAISQSKQGGIVLIDEPEISLHLEWQRKILRIISTIFKPEQIISCTHSPIIGADFELNELDFRFVGS